MVSASMINFGGVHTFLESNISRDIPFDTYDLFPFFLLSGSSKYVFFFV